VSPELRKSTSSAFMPRRRAARSRPLMGAAPHASSGTSVASSATIARAVSRSRPRAES
jgi:hypothetical protein